MQSSKIVRMSALDKEIEELTKAAQEGSEVEVKEPTQSSEETNEGSLSEESKETAEQPKEEKTEVKEDTLEYWKDRALVAEQRYNVSKPKYDSNIRKLKQENIGLQQSRIALQKELNETKQAIASKEVDKLDAMFDKQTVDVLGEKTAETIKQSIRETNDRVTAQEAAAKAAKLAADEAKVADSITGEYNIFLDELTKIVPDQSELNSDKGFLDWLDKPDELTGRIRFSLLSGAERVMDAGRVAQFFLDYKKSLVKPEPKDSVNKRIAPSKDGATSVQDIGDNGKVSIAFINNFEKEVRQGLYKGRHAEKVAIENQIDQAYITGNLID